MIKCYENSIKSIENINLIDACLNLYLLHVYFSSILHLNQQIEVVIFTSNLLEIFEFLSVRFINFKTLY